MNRTVEIIQLSAIIASCVLCIASARNRHETDHPKVYDAYCKGLMATNPDESVLWLTIAADIDPNFAKIYRGRGQAWVEKGDNVKALADYNRAVALMPHYVEAYRSRSALLFLAKDYDGAWADIRTMRRLGGTPSPQFLAILRRNSGRSE